MSFVYSYCIPGTRIPSLLSHRRAGNLIISPPSASLSLCLLRFRKNMGHASFPPMDCLKIVGGFFLVMRESEKPLFYSELKLFHCKYAHTPINDLHCGIKHYVTACTAFQVLNVNYIRCLVHAARLFLRRVISVLVSPTFTLLRQGIKCNILLLFRFRGRPVFMCSVVQYF